jgi:hypothetical protein
LLRIALCVDSICQKASIECLQCINKGQITGRAAIFCISEIRISLLSSMTSSFSSTTYIQKQEIIDSLAEHANDLANICIQPFIFHNNQPIDIQQSMINLDLLPAALSVLFTLRKRYRSLPRMEAHIINSLLAAEWQSSSFVPLFNILSELFPYLKENHLKQIKNRLLSSIKTLQNQENKDDFAGMLKICLRFLEQSRDVRWVHVLRVFFSNIPVSDIQNVEVLLEQILSQCSSISGMLINIIEDAAVNLCKNISNLTYDKRVIHSTFIEYDQIPTLTVHDLRLLLVISRTITGNYAQIEISLPSILSDLTVDSVSIVRLSRAIITVLMCLSVISTYENLFIAESDLPIISSVSLLETLINKLVLSISHNADSSSISLSSSSSSTTAEGDFISSWLSTVRSVEIISACFYMTCYPHQLQQSLDLIKQCILNRNNNNNNNDNNSNNSSKLVQNIDVIVNFDIQKLIIECLATVFSFAENCRSPLLSSIIRGIVISCDKNKLSPIELNKSSKNFPTMNKLSTDNIHLHAQLSAKNIFLKLFSILCHRNSTSISSFHIIVQNYLLMISALHSRDLESALLPLNKVCNHSKIIFGHVISTYRKFLLHKDVGKKIFAIQALISLLPYNSTISQMEIIQTLVHTFSLPLTCRRIFYIEFTRFINNCNQDEDVLTERNSNNSSSNSSSSSNCTTTNNNNINNNINNNSNNNNNSNSNNNSSNSNSNNSNIFHVNVLSMIQKKVNNRLSQLFLNANDDDISFNNDYLDDGEMKVFCPFLCIESFRKLNGKGTSVTEDICNLMSLSWSIDMRLQPKESLEVMDNISSLVTSISNYKLNQVNSDLRKNKSFICSKVNLAKKNLNIEQVRIKENNNNKLSDPFHSLRIDSFNRVINICKVSNDNDESQGSSGGYLLGIFRFIALGMPYKPSITNNDILSSSSSLKLLPLNNPIKTSSFPKNENENFDSHLACCHSAISGLLQCFLISIDFFQDNEDLKNKINNSVIIIESLLDIILEISSNISSNNVVTGFRNNLRGHYSLQNALFNKFSGIDKEYNNTPSNISNDNFSIYNQSRTIISSYSVENSLNTILDGFKDYENDSDILSFSKNLPLSTRLGSLSYACYEVGIASKWIIFNEINKDNENNELSFQNNNNSCISSLFDSIFKVYMKVGCIEMENKLLMEATELTEDLNQEEILIAKASGYCGPDGYNRNKSRKAKDKIEEKSCQSGMSIYTDGNLSSSSDCDSYSEEDENNCSISTPTNNSLYNKINRHEEEHGKQMHSDNENLGEDNNTINLSKTLKDNLPIMYLGALCGLPTQMNFILEKWDIASFRGQIVTSLSLSSSKRSNKKINDIVWNSARMTIFSLRNEILWSITSVIDSINIIDKINHNSIKKITNENRLNLSKYFSQELLKGVKEGLTLRTFRAYLDLLQSLAATGLALSDNITTPEINISVQLKNNQNNNIIPSTNEVESNSLLEVSDLLQKVLFYVDSSQPIILNQIVDLMLSFSTLLEGVSRCETLIRSITGTEIKKNQDLNNLCRKIEIDIDESTNINKIDHIDSNIIEKENIDNEEEIVENNDVNPLVNIKASDNILGEIFRKIGSLITKTLAKCRYENIYPINDLYRKLGHEIEVFSTLCNSLFLMFEPIKNESSSKTINELNHNLIKPRSCVLNLLNDRRQCQVLVYSSKFIAKCCQECYNLLKTAILISKKRKEIIESSRLTSIEENIEELNSSDSDNASINILGGKPVGNFNKNKVNLENTHSLLGYTSSIFLISLLKNVLPSIIIYSREWLTTTKYSSTINNKSPALKNIINSPTSKLVSVIKHANTLAYKIEELEWRLMQLIQEINKIKKSKIFSNSNNEMFLSSIVSDLNLNKDIENINSVGLVNDLNVIDNEGRSLLHSMRKDIESNNNDDQIKKRKKNSSSSDNDEDDMIQGTKLSLRSQISILNVASEVVSNKGSKNKKSKRLRSRNKIIDEWLGPEDGTDAFADLEDFLVE